MSRILYVEELQGRKFWTLLSTWQSPDGFTTEFFSATWNINGNFYLVDTHGDVYVCCVDDDKERGGPGGMKIASVETEDWDQKYLVESLSRSDLLLFVCYTKTKYFKQPLRTVVKYRTRNFALWKLDLKYHDSCEISSCTLTEKNNLGNEAIFVGRASSLSVSSSEIIKPNSIHFTDDNWENYIRKGGGHDRGSSTWSVEPLNLTFQENPSIPSLLRYGASELDQ